MKKLLHRPVQEFFSGELRLLRIRLSLVARFEGACKTMAASHNVNAAKTFVARFEGAEKTVAASRNVGALLNFRTHRPLPSPAELEGKVSPW